MIWQVVISGFWEKGTPLPQRLVLSNKLFLWLVSDYFNKTGPRKTRRNVYVNAVFGCRPYFSLVARQLRRFLGGLPLRKLSFCVGSPFVCILNLKNWIESSRLDQFVCENNVQVKGREERFFKSELKIQQRQSRNTTRTNLHTLIITWCIFLDLTWIMDGKAAFFRLQHVTAKVWLIFQF